MLVKGGSNTICLSEPAYIPFVWYHLSLHGPAGNVKNSRKILTIRSLCKNLFTTNGQMGSVLIDKSFARWSSGRNMPRVVVRIRPGILHNFYLPYFLVSNSVLFLPSIFVLSFRKRCFDSFYENVVRCGRRITLNCYIIGIFLANILMWMRCSKL